MIDILYQSSQENLASSLKQVLEQSNQYKVNLVPYNRDSFTTYVRETDRDTCQLVISLEMNGFSSIDSDSTPFINHLPMNVLVIMDGWPSLYDEILKMRLNYTIYFVHSDPAAVAYMRHVYPHIHVVDHLQDLNSLPAYLDSMDWRYPFKNK